MLFGTASIILDADQSRTPIMARGQINLPMHESTTAVDLRIQTVMFTSRTVHLKVI